jgi:DNA-binding GntR family transcriptional regulator
VANQLGIGKSAVPEALSRLEAEGRVCIEIAARRFCAGVLDETGPRPLGISRAV